MRKLVRNMVYILQHFSNLNKGESFIHQADISYTKNLFETLSLGRKQILPEPAGINPEPGKRC